MRFFSPAPWVAHSGLKARFGVTTSRLLGDVKIRSAVQKSLNFTRKCEWNWHISLFFAEICTNHAAPPDNFSRDRERNFCNRGGDRGSGMV